MPFSVQVTISNESELLSGFRNLLDKFPDNVQRALLSGGELLTNTAHVLVPVRTGYLRSTIGFEAAGQLDILFYARAPYAGYVEWGTRRMQARLYMTRSIEQHREDLRDLVEQAVFQTVQEAIQRCRPWING